MKSYAGGSDQSSSRSPSRKLIQAGSLVSFHSYLVSAIYIMKMEVGTKFVKISGYEVIAVLYIIVEEGCLVRVSGGRATLFYSLEFQQN